MAYIATGFTPDQEEQLLAGQVTLEQRTAEIIRRQKEEESRRRWTMLFAVAGGLFAAIKLGIVVFPTIKKRRAEKLGGL
jgi:hypothetical protein